MKLILKLTLIAAVLIVLILVLAGTYLDSIIKTGIETVGPSITGTAITLDDVDISPLSGRGRLTGVVVGNPKGFETESAFNLADARVNIHLGSVLSDRVIIEEILIESPEITFEGNLSGNNLSKIQDNVSAFGGTSGSGKTAESGSQKQEDGEKKVQINHFIVRNAKIHVSTPLLKGQVLTIPLPEIHLRDIGKESGGATLSKVASQVFGALYKAIFKAVSGSSEVLEKGMKGVSEAVKSLGGTTEKSASEVIEGIKGIFGK